MDETRRQLLTVIGTTSVAALAGCLGGDGEGTGGDDDSGDGSGDQSEEPSLPLQQQTKLVPDDGDDGDAFGGSVAMASDGSTAIVGGWGDEDPNGENAGSAYVFSQAGGGWQQEAKLLPDDGDDEDFFNGFAAVSSDGSTAIIGANGDEDPNGKGAGSAYVFSQAGGAWQQQAKPVPDDGNGGDSFGISVAISSDGSTALIGADGDDNPNGENAGSAYVFSQARRGWQQQSKLLPDDGDMGDLFGFSVALSDDGNTAIIGAEGDKENGLDAGSVYVSSQAGGGWQEEAKLLPDDGNAGDRFGSSVAMSGNGSTAIIGATGKRSPNGYSDAGAAYVFSEADGGWQQEAKLFPSDGNAGDKFGTSVVMSDNGSTAIIGAYQDEDPNGENAGSAYVFLEADGGWQQEAKLFPDDGDSDDRFGLSTGMSGNGSTAIIGAYGDEDPNGEGAGSAYVFS